ncbi:MAG TPA: protein kinase [Vicinamibacterales bacterium]
MPLLPGQRLGPYEVTGAIGAGGMGEVYRARDTKLNRDVAIKVLPDVFAGDSERLARFTREAQTLAALNHPNIAHIHGLEESGAVRALVMELVEGEDLSAHIQRGPMPLAEVLPTARQIADALETAHEQGIVHRDLKPANIKVRADGTVKVLDFGLAKAMDPAGASGAGNAANSPTMTGAATQMGVILGTAGYMAPEQARGKAVDKRADIWAFGAVVYEMLTGRRAFTGEDTSDVLAAVLRQDIDWSALPSGTPAPLRRLLERCLERDTKRRLRDIGEARVILDETMSGQPGDDANVGTPTRPTGSSRRERVWIALAVVSLVALVVLLAWTWSRPGPAPAGTVRFAIDAPAGEQFDLGAGSVDVSRDGRRLAFTTGTSPQTTKLWIRSLDSMETRQVAGVAGVAWPSWSPTGRALAFVDRTNATGPKLRRVDVDTGSLMTLDDCQQGPASWNADGVILFTGIDSRIHEISENGGTSTPVTELEAALGEVGHGSPFFLSDGRRFLFQTTDRDPQKGGIYLASLDTHSRTRVADAPRTANSSYHARVASGYLLLQRDAAIFALPFDAARGATTGEPRLVFGGPAVASVGVGSFSTSDTGVLVMHSASAAATDNQLTWFDRNGQSLGTIGGLARNFLPRISPDGSRVIVPRLDSQGGGDLFLIDVDRGVSTRITSDGTANTLAIWSPDGASIVFAPKRSGPAVDLIERPVSGDGKDVVLLSSPGPKTANGMSSDGKYVLFNSPVANNTLSQSLFALPLSGDRTPLAIVTKHGRANGATFSPDGHWIAYYSEDVDGPQAYVTPFPPTGQRIRLSTTSGYWPQWSKDGTHIIYVTEEWHFMEVPVPMINGTIRPGKPTELFIQRQDTPGWHSFAFDPVKERFLLVVSVRQGAVSEPLNVVLNWMAELGK